jgi:hypothetical protein
MFDHCLYFNSSALARLAEREWGAVYAEFGLTPPQGFVLRVVLSTPGCLSSQVADLLGRRQGETDGREWRVYATRTGKALERPINEASAQIARNLRARIGPELFEAAVTSMHDVRKALG